MIHYMTSNGLGNAWVGNELRVVMSKGIPVRLHALYRPPATFFESEDMKALAASATYLYPAKVMRVLSSVVAAPLKFRGRFFGAAWNALTGERESLTIRAKGILHLAVACRWATDIADEEIHLIHSQWIHSGGTVAMYGAWLLGVPFSFTGHAADLFRERAALKDKIRRADFIVCISSFHERFFLEQGARPEQLRRVYCGIDVSHFSAPEHKPVKRRPLLLSSGRLVEKKGFAYLIDACKILRERGIEFDCRIAGSGPLEEELRQHAARLGLQDIVEVTGKPIAQEELPNVLGEADLYCLACVWASDDDVDGLPQMLMEAMACGVPVVSTELVGIPDLVIHERTGLLAQPNDAEGLADCLQRLLQDPELAKNLAKAAREHVSDEFDISTCLEPLTNEFRRHLSTP